MHYGIDLRTVPDEMSCLDLADLVAWMPPGSPLWMSIGGPASLSTEASQLQWIDYLLRALNYTLGGGQGQKPRPPVPPEYKHEREDREAAQNRKAAAFLRRQRAS